MFYRYNSVFSNNKGKKYKELETKVKLDENIVI